MTLVNICSVRVPSQLVWWRHFHSINFAELQCCAESKFINLWSWNVIISWVSLHSVFCVADFTKLCETVGFNQFQNTSPDFDDAAVRSVTPRRVRRQKYPGQFFLRFDFSFLRSAVIPLIYRRWSFKNHRFALIVAILLRIKVDRRYFLTKSRYFRWYPTKKRR